MKTQEKRILVDMFNNCLKKDGKLYLPERYLENCCADEEAEVVRRFGWPVDLLFHSYDQFAGESSSGELRKEQIEKVLPEGVKFLDTTEEYIFFLEELAAPLAKDGLWDNCGPLTGKSSIEIGPGKHGESKEEMRLRYWSTLRRFQRGGYQNILHRPKDGVGVPYNEVGKEFKKLWTAEGKELIRIEDGYAVEQDWIADLKEEMGEE